MTLIKAGGATMFEDFIEQLLQHCERWLELGAVALPVRI